MKAQCPPADALIAEVNDYLKEDIGTGDITANIIPNNVQAKAIVVTRESMVVCGQPWFDTVFKILNPDVRILWQVAEGDAIEPGATICELNGSAKSILSGERTALNLLQTLSATATIARQYANAVAGTNSKVLDTRKTIPGLRKAQKYAVACGGCDNHRIGLYDGVLIKENHIIAAGSIAKAVQSARDQSTVPVEVEVESFHEFLEASEAKPDRIMLDNFTLEDMRSAVALNHGAIELEASGNITLDNIRTIAETGVDFISIGSLTKNIRAIDLSMRINLVTSVMAK